MRDLNQLAIDKVDSKLRILLFERAELHRDLAMGISCGVTIKEGYSIIEKINDDLEVYEHILKKLA